MEYLILVIFLLALIAKRHLDKSYFNDLSLVMGPYVIILFLHNIFMVKYLGFYRIKNEVQWAILIAILAYGFGSIIASLMSRKYTVQIAKIEFSGKYTDDLTLKIDSACNYTLFVCLVMLAHIGLTILRVGINGISANDFDALRLSGLSGHLFISLYALVPVLFYESVQIKSKKGIFYSLLTIIFSFTTFVKYNVILMVLAIGLYYIFRKRNSSKKVLIFVLGFVVAFFLLNYFLLFFVQSAVTAETGTFLKSHLWMYISSGVAMMNYTVGNNAIQYGVLDFIVQSIVAIPNMFLSLFTSFRITTNSYQVVLGQMPLMSISGERSNALSVLGSLYSNGDHLISFILSMIVWGMLVGYIVQRTKYRNFFKVSMVGVYFIAFNVLSFFANYWLLSFPWEILLFSILFEKLFSVDGGVTIKCGNWKLI